jgi:hypothetical protein
VAFEVFQAEGQSNKLNRMMHQSVEMPSRQVIFFPSA